MLQALQRNGILIGGMVACGLLCLIALPFLESPRGATGPSLLQAATPVAAIVAFLVCVALATGAAILVARWTNTAVGLFCLGAGIGAVALRLATVEEIAFGDGSPILLAVEALLLAGVALAAAAAVFRWAGPFRDVHAAHGLETAPVRFDNDALVAASAGALMLPVVWIFARSDMPGQMLAATTIGGLASGWLARILRPNVQPLLVFASPVLFGAVGIAAAGFMTGGSLDDAYVAGTIPPLLKVMPIQYLAGSLAGAAMGLGWAKGFLQHDEQEAAVEA